MMLLPGLDHFAHDLAAAMPAPGELDVRAFHGPDSLPGALEWADDAARDAVWFEFCWPPWPGLIARTDFKGRRVVVRVHRIEAYETMHAANAPWENVTDAVVVSTDMARILRGAAPGIDRTTRLHVAHNGVDVDRFRPAADPADPFRIGWCGAMILRKNPTLALEILHRLLAIDDRYTLHVASGTDDRITPDAFLCLAERMRVSHALRYDGAVPKAAMPGWHARNAVLLSTSLHESFGCAIAEAASVGCDLAVLDHLGADEFWPRAARFATVDEACWLIRNAAPGRWRGLIEQRFSLGRQAGRMRQIVLGIASEHPAPCRA